MIRVEAKIVVLILIHHPLILKVKMEKRRKHPKVIIVPKKVMKSPKGQDILVFLLTSFVDDSQNQMVESIRSDKNGPVASNYYEVYKNRFI